MYISHSLSLFLTLHNPPCEELAQSTLVLHCTRFVISRENPDLLRGILSLNQIILRSIRFLAVLVPSRLLFNSPPLDPYTNKFAKFARALQSFVHTFLH